VNPFEFLNEHFANKNKKTGWILRLCGTFKSQKAFSFRGASPLTPHQGLGNWRSCACAVKCSQNQQKNVAKSPKFRKFYGKSMSLRTTVTTECGPEVQVTAFMCMRKKKWRKRLQMLSDRWNFRLLLEVGVAESNGVVSVVANFLCACAESVLFVLPIRNLLSPSFSATSISYKGMEIFAIWQRFGLFLAAFYCACAETVISQLLATITTTPLDSATPISYKRKIFRQPEYTFCSFLHFLSRNPLDFYFRSAWPNFLKSGTRVTLPNWIPSTKFEADPTIRYQDMRPLPPIRYVTLWPWW